MPLRRYAQDAGIMDPEDVALLGRVFDRTVSEGESGEQREARASRIIGYFLAGITDESELIVLAKQPLGR